MNHMLLHPLEFFTIVASKQMQPLNSRLQLLAECLVIADLLDHQCGAVHVQRSAKDRHVVFTASLKRLRAPLHDVVAQVRHGIAEENNYEDYLQRVKRVLFTFKRRLIALQRIIPRSLCPDLAQLMHSTHVITRRIRHHTYRLDKWIADHAKWWKLIKSVN